YGQTLPDESTRVGQCPGRHEVQGVASALERVLRDRCIRGYRDTCDDQLLPRPKVALLRVRAERCVEQKTCDECERHSKPEECASAWIIHRAAPLCRTGEAQGEL